MRQTTTFPAIIGDLREVLADKRALLAVLAAVTNDRGEATPHYNDRMVEIAGRMLRLEKHALMMTDLIPSEALIWEIAEHRPIAALTDYETIGLDTGPLDDRDGIIRVHFERDMGDEVSCLIRSKGYGGARHVLREDALGVRRLKSASGQTKPQRSA